MDEGNPQLYLACVNSGRSVSYTSLWYIMLYTINLNEICFRIRILIHYSLYIFYYKLFFHIYIFNCLNYFVNVLCK